MGSDDDEYDTPLLTCLADIKPTTVKWLWQDYVPYGKLTLFAGNPGVGKSYVTCDLAARVSTGSDFPGSNWLGNAEQREPRCVVMMGTEDGWKDTIRPRLDYCNADTRRIHRLNLNLKKGGQPVSVTLENLSVLKKAVARAGDCGLIIIDPISAFMGKTDSNNNSEVRALLSPLCEFAEEAGIAIVAVHHLNKGGKGMDAISRVMGSTGLPAAARVVHGFVKDKRNPDRRIMAPIKNNLGPDRTGFAYKIINGQYIDWETAPVTESVDELISDSEEPTAVDEAEEYIKSMLADGPQLAKVMLEQVKQLGLSERTLHTAKKNLGIKPYKKGFGKGAKWFWPMPDGARATEPTEADTVDDGKSQTPQEVKDALTYPFERNNSMEPDDEPWL